MTRQRLPIGIQDFARLRETDSYYVDKTPLIKDLIDRGDYWFLSRPRRFGKSLLLDTMQTLFEGLAIYNHWDWSVTYPVVRLSFDAKYDRPEDIERNFLTQLRVIERDAELSASPCESASEYLLDLLNRLNRKTSQRVVILVDEYDKPILDALADPQQARANRDYLRGIYGTIKGSAKYVRFVFVTGVSMFSKVSLFSDLNNLKDISLDPRFASICGYTDADIDEVFAPELAGLDRDAIRTWYNGYNWRGDMRLYNPFGVLLLFDNREFRPYWFETGSPRFIFDTLKDKSISLLDLEGRFATEALVAKFEIEDISAEALMFQTGYLTITEEANEGHRIAYRLDYPNREVKLSLNDQLLASLVPNNRFSLEEGKTLKDLLVANDFEGFADQFRAWVAGIPYLWRKNSLSRYEAWYAGLLYMCFRAIGVEVQSEAASSRGRADMVVLTGGQVFIFEFKMVQSVAQIEPALTAAIAQIRNQGYAEKYQDRKDPIHCVAVACGSEDPKSLAVRVEPARIASNDAHSI
ncbi:MAG: AAA family ATPase [Aestuariivita sp.]|nr:AAA family ATPase [Aestuariivita sp.]MCY4203129.1 AAA family ATPase [Aestuariivita sp.]